MCVDLRVRTKKKHNYEAIYTAAHTPPRVFRMLRNIIVIDIYVFLYMLARYIYIYRHYTSIDRCAVINLNP